MNKRNPLPWHIETDWTVEVIAANGRLVNKFQTREEAQAFIDRGPIKRAWDEIKAFTVYLYMKITGMP